MSPLISLIIPVYNLGTRLKYMADSLKQQDYSNIEIIWVNDASTDNSRQEISNFIIGAQNDKRFQCRLVEHDVNKGVSAARNTGLKSAAGDYVAFVDGDDLLDNSFISKLYDAISSGNYEFASCGYEVLDLKSGSKQRHPLIIPPNSSVEQVLIGRILNKIEISHWATLFRRDFLLANDLFYDEECCAGEDIEFIIKVLCCSHSSVYIHDCLYIYVQHDDMGSRKDVKDASRRLRRYEHHTNAHFREAEYILKHTKDPRLLVLARNMILPQGYLRQLSICAMKKDRVTFYKMLTFNEIRHSLFNSYKSIQYKPEVFLRSLIALLAPQLYYKKYNHYLDR